MPSSKKGRLSGGARKELNERRGGDIVTAHLDAITKKRIVLDTAFARVTKHVGVNHVQVTLPARHGSLGLHVRIPNIFTRKGATPITTRSIVSIYVGPDFDSMDYTPSKGDLFDIVALIGAKDVTRLTKAGLIPEWMLRMEDVAAAAKSGEDLGFVFEDEDEDEDEEAGAAAAAGGGAAAGAGTSGFSRAGARMAAVGGDEIDIDAI